MARARHQGGEQVECTRAQRHRAAVGEQAALARLQLEAAEAAGGGMRAFKGGNGHCGLQATVQVYPAAGRAGQWPGAGSGTAGTEPVSRADAGAGADALRAPARDHPGPVARTFASPAALHLA